MTKRFALLFVVFACFTISLNAQLIIANWDNVNPDSCFSTEGTVTENVLNPNKTGINSSDSVLQFDRQGAVADEAYIIDFSSSKLITKPQLSFQMIVPVDGIIKVILQDEDLNDAASVVVDVSASSDWQEINFDFAGAVVSSKSYKRLIVYAGYNEQNTETYYFDNFQFQSGFSSSTDAVIALEKFMGSPSDENSFEGKTEDVLNWWNANGDFTNDSIVINRYPGCSWLDAGYFYPEPSRNAVVQLGAASGINNTDTLVLSGINTQGFTDYQVVFSTGGYNSISLPNVFVRKNNNNWAQLTYTSLDSVSNQIIQYKLPTGIISAETLDIMLACDAAADGQWIDDLGLIGKPVYTSTIVVNSAGGSDTLGMGTTLQLTYDAAPNNALDTSAIWSVEAGTGTASINSSGILTPITVGTVTVKATAQDGSGVIGEKTIIIVEAESVEIIPEGDLTQIIENNGALQLSATVLPESALQDVNWTIVDISDVDTATVDSNGRVTAIRNGEVEVVATTKDGTNLTDTIVITLVNQIVEPDTLVIADAVVSMDDQQVQMQIDSVFPLDADKSVTWSIDASDADTAKITETGLLTPIRNGEVTVIATSSVEGVSLSTMKNIAISGQLVDVDSLEITSSRIISVNDGTLELEAIVYPVDAANKNVTWSIVSLETEKALLEGNILTAVRNGKVKVRATSDDDENIYAEAEIILTNQVVELESLELSGNDIEVNAGTSQMTAILYPEDAQNVDLIWSLNSSIDSARATISETGLVTAFRNGDVRVIVEDKNTGLQANRTIAISEQVLVSEIILSNDADSSITQNKGTLQVYAQVLPAEARVKDIEWSIINVDGKATVNASGLVTAKANGNVYVVATALDNGGQADSMLIHISGQIVVSEVNILSDTSYIATNDGTLSLDVDVNPAEAADLSLTWSLNNGLGTIANIDESSGLITAIRNGSVVVKATSNSNTGASDTALVIIQNQIIEPESITLTAEGGADSINVNDGTLQMSVQVNPSDAVNDVVWGIVDNKLDIASVDTNGLVTAFRNGTVFVQASSTVAPMVGASYELKITNQVVEPETLKILSERGATAITRNDGTLKLVAQVTPVDAVDDVIWSIISNDADTASISEDGILQAIRNGSVTVQAVSTIVDTLLATFDVTISNQIIEPTAIEIVGSGGSNTIDENNGSLALQIVTEPADAVIDVRWSVSAFDKDTAKISSDGVVTAIRNGIASVTATSLVDESVTNVYEIVITNQVVEAESLTIVGVGDAQEILVNEGTLQMLAIINPKDADDHVIWSIAEDDAHLASIDENGLVQAISNGVVTVVGTLALADTISDEIEITILNQYILVSDIIVTAEGNATGIDVKGGTLQLYAEIIPDTATYKDLEWKSSNNEVASVSDTGLVTAIADGTILVIASATDGSSVYGSIALTITNQTVSSRNDEASEFKVFPNPVENKLFVYGLDNVTKAEIISAKGAVVDVTHAINNRQGINVSAFTAGAYILRAVSNNKVEMKVFIKE